MSNKKIVDLFQQIDGNTSTSADHHFGHNKLFDTFEPIRQKINFNFNQFENELIKRWNTKIQSKDIMLYLGDFCINKRDISKTLHNIKTITSKLQGKKVLIKGNHDKLDNHYYLNNGWDLVIENAYIFLNNKLTILPLQGKFANCLIIEINNKRIMFSHFSIFDIDDERFDKKYKEDIESLKSIYKQYNCELNIHGHVHSRKLINKSTEPVCVEQTNFYPLKISEVIVKNILK